MTLARPRCDGRVQILCAVVVICFVCVVILGRKLGYWHEPLIV